jgi:hypothetical protein
MARTRGLGRFAFYPVVLAIYGGYVWLVRLHRRSDLDVDGRRQLLAGLLVALSTLWCSILLGRLYSHVTFGTGTLVGLATGRLRPLLRRAAVTIGLVLGVVHFTAAHWPWPRWRVALPGTSLSPLVVANPDRGVDIEGARDAAAYLRDRDGRIAILTDSAQIIVVALSRATVEPVGDFSEGTNVPVAPEVLRQWEDEFIAALERSEVRFLIWSVAEVYPHRSLTSRAVRLRRFIDERYQQVRTFGRYLILERRLTAAPVR